MNIPIVLFSEGLNNLKPEPGSNLLPEATYYHDHAIVFQDNQNFWFMSLHSKWCGMLYFVTIIIFQLPQHKDRAN